MKTIWSITLLFALVMLLPCGGRLTAAESREELTRQVRQAETAFAASMADRDYKRFASFIAEDAIFFGRSGALRGKASVVEAWKGYFEGAKAPFSWEPVIVEVLDSGKLALTSGPVRDTQGTKISTFNSVWRREADGGWKVIFDKGCPDCNCNSSN
jgi:ketosteroid isomerase-like protein